MTRLFTGLALILSFVAAPAFADWEGTHWGASVDDTIAAVGGDTAKIKATDGTRVFDQDRRARGKSIFEGVAIDREFFFDPKKGLSLVKLLPRSEDCDAFLDAARKKLGPAQSAETRTILRTPMHRAVWRRREANLVILLVDVRFSNGSRVCHLIYQPYGDGEPGVRGPDGQTRPRPPAPSNSEPEV